MTSMVSIPNIFANSIPIIGMQEWAYDKKNGNERFESAGDILYSIIGWVLGFIAAYLSWQCNTAQGVNFALKLLFAFFAFIFGFIYIILYFLFISKQCSAPTPATTNANA